MQTLSHGLQKPEDGDAGAVFFPALEEAIQRLNDHTHDGLDAERLSALASVAISDTPALSWADTGDSSGTFRALVTLPLGLLFDAVSIVLRTTAGAQLYIDFAKVSPTTFYVYSNDDALAIDVVYST